MQRRTFFAALCPISVILGHKAGASEFFVAVVLPRLPESLLIGSENGYDRRMGWDCRTQFAGLASAIQGR